MLAIGDLKQIIQLGGGVRIDASHYAVISIKECVRLAGDSKAQIVLSNAKALSTADIKAIAQLAPGQVIFELVS